MRFFYPAAAAYAALILPISALSMPPRSHAHEMLLGFALAVVAGNQLGVVPPRRVATMLVAWAAARTAFLVAPASLATAALNAAFAALLAFHVAPRLLGAAKKWRNRALPAVLISLCAAAAAWQFAEVTLATVALFALLMLFMGGRIIAPAVAGQLYRQGKRLDARVQPRIEAALIVAGFAAAIALAAGARVPAAAALAAAGSIAAVRLARWRLWLLRGRRDLLCLAAGYAWLAFGLLVFGAALAAGRHESAALHLITVGALGSLTLNVMAQSWLLKARRDPSRSLAIVAGTVLVGFATVFRVFGVLAPAAACWSAAFAVLLLLFFKSY
jgi:uncharacterized protein involved in response to NO